MPFQSSLKRGRGRPKLIRNGRPGRPRKLYQEIQNEGHEEPRTVKEATESAEKDL